MAPDAGIHANYSERQADNERRLNAVRAEGLDPSHIYNVTVVGALCEFLFDLPDSPLLGRQTDFREFLTKEVAAALDEVESGVRKAKLSRMGPQRGGLGERPRPPKVL